MNRLDNSDKGTSNIDLKNMAKDLGIRHFKGVFMNDEIDEIHENLIFMDNEILSKRLNEMNFIVNFQNSNQGGTHWVCVIVHKNKNYYFDPYGAEVPNNIRKFLGKNITRSNYQIQNYNTFSCGEFCILVIYLVVEKGMKYEDVIFTMLDKADDYNIKNNIINRVGE